MFETKLQKFPAGARFRLLAAAFCLAFGVAYILNVHPIGDGLWFWYAVRVRQGAKLYSDMHLSLQPLYVLLTAVFQQVFGLSWLASKILPALQLVFFCVLLYRIAGYIRWPDWARAVVVVAVYLLTISGQYYRFDDYHITSDVLGLVCIYLLLRLQEEKRPAVIVTHALLIGTACGLCVGNRLNDGATLFVGSSIALAFVAKRKKLEAVLLAGIATAAGLLLVVLLTRDSLHRWAVESILRASKIKGGTGNILLFPLELPGRLVKSYKEGHPLPGLSWFFVLLACAYVFRRFWPMRSQAKIRLLFAATSAVALVGIFLLREPLRGGSAVQVFSTTASLAILLGALYVLGRAIFAAGGRRPSGWSSRELLLLIPAAQLLAGAMTSATVLPNLTPPVAMALLVLPLVLAPKTGRQVLWAVVTVCAAVILPAVLLKVRHPYYWHHYIDGPMFAKRTWYDHPEYGEMYIETSQLAEILPICQKIGQSSAPRELLSLPYPYPNYFCGIAPWHDYVQTWYDTAGRETIQALTAELNASPPAWIAYQHDLDTMAVHEWAFTHNTPLPHRELERMIASRIAAGRWAIESRSCLDHSEWMLIRTAPPVAAEERALLAGFLRKPAGLCQ